MGAKIMIIDDDPVACELATFLLNAAGYDTDVVRESSKALAAIKEKRPQLVILDIIMPGTDGLSLLHALKSDPDYKSLKVVMVSTKTFPEDKATAEKFGADAFIDKPYPTETFAQRVLEVLDRPHATKIKTPPKDAE